MELIQNKTKKIRFRMKFKVFWISYHFLIINMECVNRIQLLKKKNFKKNSKKKSKNS